jgi:tetratricopeptide (TPR) repeat protein
MVAIVLSMTIVSAEPDYVASLGVDYWAARAQHFADQEEWVAAVDCANEVVRLEPLNPNRYIERAQIRMRAGDLWDSLRDLSLGEERFNHFGYRSMIPDYLRGEVYYRMAFESLQWTWEDFEETRAKIDKIEEKKESIKAECLDPKDKDKVKEDKLEKFKEDVAVIKADFDDLGPRLTLAELDLDRSEETLEKSIESYSRALARLPVSDEPRKARQLPQAELDRIREVKELVADLKEEIAELSAKSFEVATEGKDVDETESPAS